MKFMRSIGTFLIERSNYAAFVAFFCALISFFGIPTGWISAIIIGLITLQKGWRTGVFILAWSCLPAIAMVISGRWQLLLTPALFDLLLVWVFAVLLKKLDSWALVLQFAALLGIVGVLVVHGIIPNTHSWWVTKINDYLQQINFPAKFNLTSAKIHRLVIYTAEIATGIQISFVLMASFLYLYIASLWERKSYTGIRISKIFSFILIICLFAVVFNVDVAKDIIPVVLLPFILAGLNFMHTLAKQIKYGAYMIAGVYVSMFIFTPYVLSFLILAAFVDSWYDFKIKYRSYTLK